MKRGGAMNSYEIQVFGWGGWARVDSRASEVWADVAAEEWRERGWRVRIVKARVG
jgi:hypothetical protein